MSEEASKLPKDIAAAEGKVNVQINGTWHRFPRGTRIADACRSVGVPIPCFCYHPKLAVAGSCRPAPSSPAQTRWRKTWASARTAPWPVKRAAA